MLQEIRKGIYIGDTREFVNSDTDNPDELYFALKNKDNPNAFEKQFGLTELDVKVDEIFNNPVTTVGKGVLGTGLSIIQGIGREVYGDFLSLDNLFERAKKERDFWEKRRKEEFENNGDGKDTTTATSTATTATTTTPSTQSVSTPSQKGNYDTATATTQGAGAFYNEPAQPVGQHPRPHDPKYMSFEERRKALIDAQERMNEMDFANFQEFLAIEQDYQDRQAAIRSKLMDLKKSNDMFIKNTGLDKSINDRSVLYDIGSVGGSIGAFVAISAITHNPYAASIAIGLYQRRVTYEEMIESGVSPARANAVSLAAGGIETVLEGAGLTILFKAMKNRGMANIITRYLTEAFQEGAQTAGEEAVMQLWGGREKEFRETLEEIAYSAFLGFVGGVAPATVGSLYFNAQSKHLQNTFGLEKDAADRVVEASQNAGVSVEMTDTGIKILDNQGSVLAFKDRDPAAAHAELKKAADAAYKKMTPEKRKQINDIRAAVKQDALNEGLAPEVAEFASQAIGASATLYHNFAGMSPAEYWQKHKLKIINELKQVTSEKMAQAAAAGYTPIMSADDAQTQEIKGAKQIAATTAVINDFFDGEDLNAAGKRNPNKNLKALTTAMTEFQNNVRDYGFATQEGVDAYTRAVQHLKDNGFEVVDLLGKSARNMTLDVDTVHEDESSLNKPDKDKEPVITKVYAPQINKDGKTVLNAKVDITVMSKQKFDEVKKEDKKNYFQKGYHGGAKKGITQFSNDFIGSGSGSTSFGWGHYFTSLKEIAEWYMRDLAEYDSSVKVEYEVAGDKYTIKSSKQFDDSFPISFVEHELFKNHGNKIAVREAIRQHLRDNLNKDVYDDDTSKDEAVEIAYDFLDSITNIKLDIKSGQVYQVELPESDEFLQWDKPLSEQSDKVQKAVKKLSAALRKIKTEYPEGRQQINEMLNSIAQDMSGEKIYLTIASIADIINDSSDENTIGDTQRWASKTLLKYGIKGNEYPVGSLSNIESTGRNFVVFDPETVEITKTYYQSTAKKTQNLQTLKTKISNILKNKIRVGNLRLDYTPPALQAAGLKNHPLQMNATTLLKAAGIIAASKGNYHTVTQEDVERVFELLHNPLFVYEETRDGRKEYVAVLDAVDKNGKQVVAPISPPTKENGGVNFIPTLYARAPIEKLANNKRIVVLNEKGLTSSVKPQLPTRVKESLSGIIKQKNKNVKIVEHENIDSQTFNSDETTANDGGFVNVVTKASVTFNREQRLIQLFENHDKSSLVHELGHIFLSDIAELAEMSVNNPGLVDSSFLDFKAKIDKYLGVKPGQVDEDGKPVAYTTRQHERFARAFVAYVQSGRAPNSAMRTLFERFRGWLRDLKDVFVSTQIKRLAQNPEMIEVFDMLLAPMEFDDVAYSQETVSEIEKTLDDIKSGKDIEITGQKLEEARNYLNQINKRRPALPKEDLLHYLKTFGVKETFALIDKARAAGIKIVKQGDKGFERALGEDNLQNALMGLGFLQTARADEANTAASDDLQAQSLSLLEKALDGQKVFAADDAAKVEAVENYDRGIDAITEMFGGDLQEAQKVLDAIDTLADKNFAVLSYDQLEYWREMAGRVAAQNAALGKGRSVEDIEKEIVQDKTLLKNKAERLQKRESDLAKKEKNLAEKEKDVNAKIDVKKEKAQIEKDKKYIAKDKQYIDEQTGRLAKKEKDLKAERKLYKDIKDAVDEIADRNKDLGKKINKKDIEDAVKTMNREKLLAAVNDALAEIEKEFAQTPEYLDQKTKHENPAKIILEKKEALLKTAKKRIADKTDATGFRAALRSALSGIPHFSNTKRFLEINKQTKVMTAKEEVLHDWQNISSWQELVDNLDKIFNTVQHYSEQNFQKFMFAEIFKEISKNVWVKRGKQKIGRYGDVSVEGMSANEFFKILRDIWEADPKELANEVEMEQREIDKDLAGGFDFLQRIENRLKWIKVATSAELAAKGSRYLEDLYADIMKIRQAANEGKSLKDLTEKIDLFTLIDELSKAARSNINKNGINPAMRFFLRFSGNWDSYINALFGKKYVNQFSMLIDEQNADTQSYIDKNKIADAAARIYGISRDQFTDLYRQMLNDAEIYNDYKASRNKEPRGVSINKAEIITMYIWYKNDLGKKRLLQQFEPPVYDEDGNQTIPATSYNIDAMFNKLTDKDKQFADFLQKSAQQYYESVNEVFYRLYGLDLKQEDFYYPFKTYSGEKAGDLEALQSAYSNGSHPSQTKERIQSAFVRMKPEGNDALKVLFNHVNTSNKYIFTQEKLLKLRKIFKNAEIENAITMAGVEIKKIGGASVVNGIIEKIKSLLPVELAGKIKTRDQAITELKKIAGKEIINKETGQKAQVNTEQRDKLVSDAAIKKSVDNGFTKEQHLEAASKIDKLFENAVLLKEGEDKEGDKNIKSIKRFVAPVKFGGDTDYSYMLVKESVEHGNRIYTLELVNKKGLESIVGKLQELTRLSSPENNISQKNKVVKTGATFGKDVYNGFINILDKSSIATHRAKLLIENNVLHKIVNNFLKTAVAVKPIIAIKQMAAFINYSEGIPKTDFISGVTDFFADWKKAADFMMQDEYIQARFAGGLVNETLKRAMQSQVFSRFSKWSDMLTFNVRFGDKVSVLVGGYARVKYLMAHGKTKEEAFTDFRLQTMRTQQASVESSLSMMQSSDNALAKLVLAFRNTPNQYARKIADAYIQFRRGEITLEQFGEIVFMYAIANPMIYAALTYGITGFFDDDDEDDDVRNIFLSPLTVTAGFFPIIDDALLTLSNALISGKIKAFDKGEILGAADFWDWLGKGVKAVNDNDKMNFYDWLKFIDFPPKVAIGVPVETVVTMFSGVYDAYKGEEFKGALKTLGYTNYRAGMIANGRYIKDNKK
ncbi:MAG: hypothetical protein LBL00_07860 [Endomicrobium sp.]|jgi:hypothetical protein|nr:hypothetical protein [Endomicrobium sp.]